MTRNPDYNPADPPSTNNPPTIADEKKIGAVVSALQSANEQSAPFNPYSVPVGGLILAGGALATWISRLRAGGAVKSAALQTLARATTNEEAISNAASADVAAEIARAQHLS